jgi:hypothetical protein
MADSGLQSPLIDLFRRGEVARDVRELAARGALVPGPHEQLGLLVLLVDDPDPGIAAAADETLAAIPVPTLAAFLARPEVPARMREYFAARGVQPSEMASADGESPLVPIGGEELAAEHEKSSGPAALSALSVTERVKLAMKGTREQRTQLVRDPNRMVSAAVLSSPKLTDAEVEQFAKMANVSEEVLRIIATNRHWTKNYAVVAALLRNPKTPPALSLRLLPRLVAKDVKGLATDRNVPEALRIAARKVITKGL